MNIKDQVWATFCNMKYKGFVLGLLAQKYQKLDRNVNITLAVASSSSIAAWAVWKDYPLVWSGIIAFSQVIMTIKPYFPYQKIAKEINTRCLKMELLNNEYERFWNKIKRGKLSDDTIDQTYFDYNKLYTETLNFPDDMVLSTSTQIEQKAGLRIKNYFKTCHGIETTI